jgi:hypothetical protein
MANQYWKGLSNESNSGTKPHQPQFPSDVALARAVMVVDEDLSELIPLLKNLGFRVFSLVPGIDDNRMAHSTMEDLEIAHLLCNRILVTRRAGVFRYAAPVHEFSIIDIAECPRDDLASVAYETSQHWNQLRLRDKQTIYPAIAARWRAGA